jgi:protein-S-isoprenylcysteine O-methyltransferase Ste14
MGTAVTSVARAQRLEVPIGGAAARHAIGNILVALTFFGSMLPTAQHFGSGPANFIWLSGALIMGVMSLVRFPPRAALMSSKAIVVNAVALVLPALVRPAPASVGLIASIAIGTGLCGVVLSQVGRIYMGRSFGILPGNRGIVIKGPFRIVRHPIYAGWFLLTLGFFLAYPSWINFLIVAGASPFMIWRIFLEEQLLLDDPEYRKYAQRVRSRLIPCIF